MSHSALPDPTIPSTTPPEDVIKWVLFYLNGFTTSVQQMTEVLATEQFVESHPKAIVTLRRRAADMDQFNQMLTRYLAERQPTLTALTIADSTQESTISSTVTTTASDQHREETH